MIASVAYQQSEKKGDKLIVTQKVPLLPRGARAPAPDAKDPNRLPDRYVNSDDPEIIKLAAKIVGKETDISRKVMLMNSWVFRHIEKKNFSVGYASASEVVRNLEGDCTEHSVLFAALAREVQLPAFDSALDYAVRHREVIVRFGRFPHRNALLGRASTAEESAFLAQPGSSF